jgi:hypothetical protein
MSEQPPETTRDDTSTDAARRVPERAAFLDDFPDHPELTPLIRAFEVGNYAALRKLEASLRERCHEPETLDLARELVERTDPDPTAKRLLLLATGFFLFIVVWVYLNHGY